MNTFMKHITMAFIAAFISTMLMVVSFAAAGMTTHMDKVPQTPSIRNGYFEITPFLLLKNKNYEVISSSTSHMTNKSANVSSRSYMFYSEEGYAVLVMAVTRSNSPINGLDIPGRFIGTERHGDATFKVSYFFDDSKGLPGRTCKVWTSLPDRYNHPVRIIYMEIGDQTAELKDFLQRAGKEVEFKIIE